MNVLVVGGNVFLGSYLVDGLIKIGYNVRVFDSFPERYREPLKEINYRIADWNNADELKNALQGIDVVFHLASTIVPSTSNVVIVSDIKNNILSSIQLVDLAVTQGIKKIVFFSSGGAVYGQPETLPISVMEAFGQAVPVIGARIGGIPALVEDGVAGYLFESGNSMNLQEKVKLVLLNWEQLGKNAFSLASTKYNQEAHYTGLLNIYRRLFNKSEENKQESRFVYEN